MVGPLGCQSAVTQQTGESHLNSLGCGEVLPQLTAPSGGGTIHDKVYSALDLASDPQLFYPNQHKDNEAASQRV